MPLLSPVGAEPLGSVVLRPHAPHRRVFGNIREKRDIWGWGGLFFFSMDSADVNPCPQMQILHEPRQWVFYEREVSSHRNSKY